MAVPMKSIRQQAAALARVLAKNHQLLTDPAIPQAQRIKFAQAIRMRITTDLHPLTSTAQAATGVAQIGRRN